MQIPKDPLMLMSYLNTKLRDAYSSFSALCEDLELDEAALTETLQRAGYAYQPERNQFLPAKR